MTVTLTDSADTDEATDEAYVHLLPEMQHDPIFILGCHRSGTTFVYQSLADTGRYNYITPYDIVHYERLLSLRANGGEAEARERLQERLVGLGDTRGIDDVGVGVGRAEEYGFILPKNPERFMFVPQLLPPTLARFVQMCRKKEYLDGVERPLLLKNPDDFYGNFLYIHEQFPQSKLLMVHRHPLTVLNSHIRAWTRMVDSRNEYFAMLHPIYNAMFDHPEVILKHRMTLKTFEGVSWMFSEFIRSFQYYFDHIGRLSEDSVLVLRYEDLCRDPQVQFGRISEFVGQPCRPEVFADCVRQRPVQILPVVQQVYDAMHDQVRFYLDALDYGDVP